MLLDSLTSSNDLKNELLLFVSLTKPFPSSAEEQSMSRITDKSSWLPQQLGLMEVEFVFFLGLVRFHFLQIDFSFDVSARTLTAAGSKVDGRRPKRRKCGIELLVLFLIPGCPSQVSFSPPFFLRRSVIDLLPLKSPRRYANFQQITKVDFVECK